MTSRSWLPPGGENVFQVIKEIKQARIDAGLPIIDMSVGEPDGPPKEEVLLGMRKALDNVTEKLVSYQDNGCYFPDFAKEFVWVHVGRPLKKYREGSIVFAPIPGIKPMIGPVISACGGRGITVAAMPGYGVPQTQCGYLRAECETLVLDNEFLPTLENIKEINPELLMLNFPHNPTGQIATGECLREICRYCERESIRIFNDAAYASLTFNPKATLLTKVAWEFENLSWMEAYSASKGPVGNCTGLRVGAMVGSPGFMGDFLRIKSNSDSGLCAIQAAGIMRAISSPGKRKLFSENKKKYQERMYVLLEILEQAGMKIAIKPQAGFFALYRVPEAAFGIIVEDAKHFNNLMIEKTGVIGVPITMNDKSYIRYTCAKIPVQDYREEIQKAFELASVSY